MKRDFAVAVKAVIIKENKALVLCRSKHEMECSYIAPLDEARHSCGICISAEKAGWINLSEYGIYSIY